MDTQYVSREKLEELKAELQQLRRVDMQETAVRIDEARQMGDLSENAEYHAAREQLAWQTGRAKELEAILEHAEIIEKSGNTDKVTLGSTVRVKVEKTGKEKDYKIVGAQEADPLSGMISNESPLGLAFLGKSKGEKVEVEVPAGVQIYEILSIS